MNKSRILQIAGMRHRAGIENFIMNVVDNIDTSRIQIDFLYTWTERGPFDDRLERKGCKLYRIDSYGKNPIKIISHTKQLYNLLKNNKDIGAVHIHGNTAIGCLDACIAKISGIKRVIVHSHNSGVGSFRSKLLHKIIKRIIDPFIDDRFACSEQAWNWMFLKHNKYSGVNKIIQNGIDTKKYVFNKDIRKYQKEKWGLKENLTVGFVGRLTEQKNPLFLLEIFNSLLKFEPKAKLMIVGDGEYKEVMQKKVLELNIDEQVIFTGVQPNVNDLMQAMDVFILPSVWEGLGIVLIEAQAAGIPCIVSDIIAEEVLITNLITKISLKENVDSWAKTILNAIKYNEKLDTYKEIVHSGFDIKTTAEWLEAFYLGEMDCE